MIQRRQVTWTGDGPEAERAQPTGPVAPVARPAGHGSFAGRRATLSKVSKVLALLVGLLEGLLALRFALKLAGADGRSPFAEFVYGVTGANGRSPFAEFVYGVTGVFVAPFQWMFATGKFEESQFEWLAVVAIAAYALLAWLLLRLLWLFFREDRRTMHQMREAVASDGAAL